MKKMNNNNKGFTLVELIIVIAIIAILLALITPNLTAFLGTAEETSSKANAKTAYTSAFAWATSKTTEGVTVPVDSTATITKDASGKLVITASTGDEDDFDGLDGFFISDELPDDVSIEIAFGDNNSVKHAKWTDDTQYPSN